ncbi:MAG: OmpA family protein [Mycobacterium sp.]
MPGSEEIRTTTQWRTASRFYRRPPGLGWLLALLAVPLLLGAIGYGIKDRDADVDVTMPTVDPTVTLTAPTVTAPNVNVPALSFAGLSISRNGNDFTLSGELPDLAAETSLLDSLKGALGGGVNLIDNINIKPDISAPDFSGLGALFRAAVDIPDFKFDLNGDTITLTGTAPSEDAKAAVEAAAKAAWPNLKVVNEIRVTAPTGAPAPAGECANLQADIAGLLRTPITFETDGFTLTPGTEQMLTEVANKLKACPNSRIAVEGYTDNTGNDAINIPLSGNRAKSVADYLVAQGVAGDAVTSKGLGAANPVASNDTPDGRAQNRRVVILVS